MAAGDAIDAYTVDGENSKESDAGFLGTLGQCFGALFLAVGIEAIATLLDLLEILKAQLEAQLAVLFFRAFRAELSINVATIELNRAIAVIQEMRNLADKIPTEVVQGCPPLDTFLTAAVALIQAPIKIPFTGKTVDPLELAQELQDLTSLRQEISLGQEILRDTIEQLAAFINLGRQFLINKKAELGN